MELQPRSNHGFDAIGPLGLRVEIRATIRCSVSVSSANSSAVRMIVVKLDAKRRRTMVFDGPIEVRRGVAGKPQRIGGRRVTQDLIHGRGSILPAN